MSLFPAEWSDFEPSVFDRATLLEPGDAEAKVLPPWRQDSPHTDISQPPRGFAILEGINSQMQIENGGALVINENWVATAAHCVASIKDGKIVRNWGELIITFGCNDRNVKQRRQSIREVWVDSGYQSDRGGYSHDVALLRLAEPVPNELVMETHRYADHIAQAGEKIVIPNMGSSGDVGDPNNGPLHDCLVLAEMVVDEVNPVYLDLKPAPGIARPGASGGPGFDGDGPEKGAVLGLVSTMFMNASGTTLTPARYFLPWAYETAKRRDVAYQMGELTSILGR